MQLHVLVRKSRRPRTPNSPRSSSPRSTRHKMISNELPESLRKHLLWERQVKSAVLQRRRRVVEID